MKLLTLPLLPLFLAFAAVPSGAAVQWTSTADALTVTTPAYRLVMDARTGAPRELLLKGKEALTFGEGGWWRLNFEKEEPLRASDCGAKIDHTADEFNAAYTSLRAAVSLRIHFEEERFDIRAHVHAGTDVVTRLALPEEGRFQPASLNQLYFPLELGMALKPSFFGPQPEDRPARWGRVAIGGGGAEGVGIHPTDMRDYNEPAVPVTVTAAGREWLGSATEDLSRWTVRCPRPPAGAPDVTLLQTPSGPLLSLERVDGGWGWFVRWGGVFNEQDGPRVRAASVRTLAALWAATAASGAKIAAPANVVGRPRREVMPALIGIIDLDSASRAGEWKAALSSLGCKMVSLRTPTEILARLQKRDCWLIVNPYGEILPAAAAQQAEMAAAIRSYLANGGVWLHTGSAPFFYALQAEPFLSLSSSYPPAFSDFLHLDTAAGQVSLYGVRDPAAVFVPAQLSVGGAVGGGRLSREWITWVDPGKSWDAPVTRFRFGNAVQDSIREYGAANGFTRSLADKVRPEVLTRLKESLLLKYSGASYRDEAKAVAGLPQPILVHVSDYLHGGFDKQYPDHLPPNPSLGTAEDFAGFIKAVHGAGDLFMPYTNPTWWCDNPPGPTFLQAGDAPLVKDRQGKRMRELYAANGGWSLTAFHPAALAAEKTILRQFTQDYPADVLFQDQVGARSPQYDFNPTSPTPYAYTQGMLDIGGRDSKTIPLGTENGFDAAMNGETLFCGIAWGTVPTENGPDWRGLWKDAYPAGTWQLAPLAQWLGHDRTIFTLHDLGQFVTNREVLAWTLALGYKLSAVTEASAVGQGEKWQWIEWLAALQKALGPRLDGARLDEWSEPSPGIYVSRWGNLQIWANTTPAPYGLDANTTLSPFGFYMTSAADGFSAGWLDRYRGQDYQSGYAFVQSGSQLTVYQPDGSSLLLPGRHTARTVDAALLGRAVPGGLEVALPHVQPSVPVPAPMQKVAPRDRPTPPHTIGVLDMPWMTYGWASTRAEDWEQGLTAALADLHLTVKPLRSPDELKAAMGNPTEVLAIVNPYGEHFPVPGPERWQEVLSAGKSYCAHGGAWFETSASPFYQAVYRTPGDGVATDDPRSGGLGSFGYHAVDLGNDPPPVPLKASPAGVQWLGAPLTAAVQQSTAVVNRPFAAGEASLDLVTGGGNGFVSGVRPGGWGWLWRLGGSDPSKTLSIPIVAAIIRHLDTASPLPVPASRERYVYRLEVD